MNLYYFNPGCEIEVAAGKAVYSLPKYPAMLERDLSVLPMCFAERGDCVITSPTQDADFKAFWSEYFGCEFVGADARGLLAREFDFYKPWGISPRILRIGDKYKFSSLFHNSPVARWQDEHKQLFSRATSSLIFGRMACMDDYDDGIFILKNQLPKIAKSWDEALDFFNSSVNGAVFKAIFGSSGRGVRILKNNEMTPNLENWIRSIIKAQGAIACEHYFEKVADFSCHYDIMDGRAKFVGISTFDTSETGAYIGSIVGRRAEIPLMKDFKIEKLADIQTAALMDSPYTKFYCGPLGIDCMVYREGDSLKINPCIEINCRHSMGRLAMEIEDLVGARAEFIVFPNNAKPSVSAQKPVFSNGKLVDGYLSLTPKDSLTFSAGIYCF